MTLPTMPANADPGTLIDLLDRAAERHGEAPALSVRDGLRTQHWTYAALRQRVDGMAALLRSDGRLAAGDCVLICAPNAPATVAAHLGIMRAGLIAVPLDLGSSPDFVAAVARRTGATAIVTATGTATVPGLGGISLADLERAALVQPPIRKPGADDIAEIVFTSGTTGDPKGTVLSHGNIASNAIAASAVVPAAMPLRLLSILPLSHMLEQTVGLYLPMLKSGSVHYMMRLQPAALLREMRRQRVTGLVVVPRILEMLSRAIEQGVRQAGLWPRWQRSQGLARHLPIDLRRHLFRRLHAQLGGSLHFVLCGGATLPEPVAEWWEQIGVHVIVGYGSTECAPVIAATTYDWRPAGAVGRPLAGVAVKLSDDGEIRARGPNVARGYWQDTARTAAVFSADGWFRTGDIGEIGADGVIRITGRLGDRIVLASGQKIFPADIEDQLRKEPGIADCVVVALADAAGHDRIHASLRLADGAAASAAAAAVRAANQRLGSHQQIVAHSTWTAGDFPRTSLGKIRRRAVQEALAASGPQPAAAGTAGTPADAQTGDLIPLLRQVCGNDEVEIAPDSLLVGDLGLDSLAQVELVAAIEDRLGIMLDETHLAAAKTVRDLQYLVDTGTRSATDEGFSDWPLGRGAGALRAILQPALLFPLHRCLARSFVVTGAESLAGLRAPVLFAANHSSHVDTLSLLRALPQPLRRTVTVAAASDYFYRNPVAGVAASLLLNTFPFSRSGQVRASLERCGELVDRGRSILIYPEGTRSPDARVLPFKSGIGLLARGLGIPVVPVAVSGGSAILPKGEAVPRRGPVRVSFGPPQHFSADADPEATAQQLHRSIVRLLEERPADAR